MRPVSPPSPIKSEFIRAKYQMLAFVHKLPCRDDDGVTAKDLSKVGGAPGNGRASSLDTCDTLRVCSFVTTEPEAPEALGSGKKSGCSREMRLHGQAAYAAEPLSSSMDTPGLKPHQLPSKSWENLGPFLSCSEPQFACL